MSEARQANASRRRVPWCEWAKHGIMLGIVALVLYPFAMLVVLSLKDNAQFFHEPWLPTWPLHPGNYSASARLLIRYILNSIFVSGASCAGVLLLSSFSAFTFARFQFFGRRFLFLAIIVLMMVPGILGLVPTFMVVKNLGLLNTRWALILPYIAGGQVVGIFLLRSFFSAMPDDLFDAAKIDGAGDFRMYASVALPLCKPMLATIAIMNVQATWNDLIWPLVCLSDDKLKTVSIGLLSFQSQVAMATTTRWGPLFAGYVVASIPLLLLFLVASRAFVQGLTSGALKA